MTLRKWLTVNGISDAELGRMMGVSRSMVGLWASRKNEPPLWRAVKLVKLSAGVIDIKKLTKIKKESK